MSENFKSLNWIYNPENNVLEVSFEIESSDGIIETKILEIPETSLIEMSALVPALSEKQKMVEMLNLIYKIQEEQLLTVDGINSELSELIKEHTSVREELSQGNLTKEDILALSTKSKDLTGVKTVYAERRHLIKLLTAKEADLRAKLAKMQAGYM